MTLLGKGFKTTFFIWALASGVLFFDIGFYLFAIRPKAVKLVYLENEYLDKRAAELELPSESPGSMDKGAKSLYQRLPQWGDFTKVMGDIYNKAERLELAVDSASYQSSSIKDSDIVKVTVTMPVIGAYENIKRFIYELETSPRFFAIEGLSLGSGRGEDEDVSLKLAIVVHFRG